MSLTFTYGTQKFDLVNYGDHDKVYFKARDIALFLGYKNTRGAIIAHVWDKNKLTVSQLTTCPISIPSPKLDPQTILINEAGLYQLIFSSKMDFAQMFQEWIFNTVLPSIRKTGQFMITNKPIRVMTTFKIETENDLHVKVINFINIYYPDMLRTICNPELSNDTAEKRIKCAQLGYKAGTFDILINNLHKSFNGFAIELKSPKGTGVISEAQQLMKTTYESNNFKVLISNDYDQIITSIIDYMANTRVKCTHCMCRFKSTKTLKNHHKGFHRIIS